MALPRGLVRPSSLASVRCLLLVPGWGTVQGRRVCRTLLRQYVAETRTPRGLTARWALVVGCFGYMFGFFQGLMGF